VAEEYSRGSFSGRFRDWRSRRAGARAAARWPTPAEFAPEATPEPPAEDPLAIRWLPDAERRAEPAAPQAGVATLTESSRWLTGDDSGSSDTPTAATGVLTAPAPADWLPKAAPSEQEAPRTNGDSSRWVPPDTDTGADTATTDTDTAPAETPDERRAAAEAYCLVLCEPAAAAAAAAQALDEADSERRARRPPPERSRSPRPRTGASGSRLSTSTPVPRPTTVSPNARTEPSAAARTMRWTST